MADIIEVIHPEQDFDVDDTISISAIEVRLIDDALPIGLKEWRVDDQGEHLIIHTPLPSISAIEDLLDAQKLLTAIRRTNQSTNLVRDQESPSY